MPEVLEDIKEGKIKKVQQRLKAIRDISEPDIL